MESERRDFPGEHLDMARGLAALAVAGWHWRNLFFRPREAGQGPLLDAFYALTGFGEQAVFVFFALSGYFITRSILHDRATGRWGWRRYLIARGSRLYLVLVPALVLGAAWDHLGLWAFGPDSMYDGRIDRWGPLIVSWPVAAYLTWGNFLGCLAFLQAIRTPVLGSNGALWSLAYEGWYYLLFPLGLVALGRGAGWRQRLVCAALCGALAFGVLTPRALGGMILWLMGAFVAVLPVPARRAHPAWAWAALAAIGAALVGARLGMPYGGWAASATTAALIYALVAVRPRAPGGWYGRASAWLSGCSYTLYLVHTPILFFLANALTGGARWRMDPAHGLMAAAVLLGVLLYARALAAVTEDRTPQVRAWLEARLPGGRRAG